MADAKAPRDFFISFNSADFSGHSRHQDNHHVQGVLGCFDISIPGHEANSAGSFELATQLVGVVAGHEGTELNRINHTALALILPPNHGLVPFKHCIFRFQGLEYRLRLSRCPRR